MAGQIIRCAVLTSSFLFYVATGSIFAQDYSVGNADEINWHGAASNILSVNQYGFKDSKASDLTHYSPNPDSPYVPDVALPDEFVNANTDVEYYSSVDARSTEAWVSNSPYEMNGYLYDAVNPAYAEPADISTAWRSGGFFRDELYFETANGQPGNIELVFNVHAFIWANQDVDESYARFEIKGAVCRDDFQYLKDFDGNYEYDALGRKIPTERDFYWMGNLLYDMRMDGAEWMIKKGEDAYDDFEKISGPYDDPYEIDEELIFSTANLWSNKLSNPGAGLIGSGTYLPITISGWAQALDGYVDWSDTLTLTGVNVYDSNGNPMDPDDYKLLSKTDNFRQFNNEGNFGDGDGGNTVVPEPATMVLVSLGGLAMAAMRRKRKI